MKPFFTCGYVVLLAVALGFPVVAFSADVGGWSSFTVGKGVFTLYQFMWDGGNISIRLVPMGALTWAMAGGFMNLALRPVVRRIVR